MSPQDTNTKTLCERLQESIVVDKSQPLDLSGDMKLHVSQCVECRTFVDDYSSLLGGFNVYRESVLDAYELSLRSRLQLQRTLIDLVSEDVRLGHQRPRSWWSLVRGVRDQITSALTAVLASSPGLRLATQLMILVAVGILAAVVWQVNAEDAERAVFAAEIHSVSPVVPIPVDPDAFPEPLHGLKSQAERMDLSPAILSQTLSGKDR